MMLRANDTSLVSAAQGQLDTSNLPGSKARLILSIKRGIQCLLFNSGPYIHNGATPVATVLTVNNAAQMADVAAS